jgi:hypothetical protein
MHRAAVVEADEDGLEPGQLGIGLGSDAGRGQAPCDAGGLVSEGELGGQPVLVGAVVVGGGEDCRLDGTKDQGDGPEDARREEGGSIGQHRLKGARRL